MKTSGPRPVKAVISYPTRAFKTNYQNLTGRPLLVIVWASCHRSELDTPNYAYIRCLVGLTSPPTPEVCRAGARSTGGPQLPETLTDDVATFMVPPGYYYRVEDALSANSSVTQQEWSEIEL